MLKILLWVTLAVVSASEGCTYKKSECPNYSVVEQHPDYEIRSYPDVTWATTTGQSRFQRVARYTAFMRLLLYIGGKNDKEQKMAMTVPVRMQDRVTENGTLLEMGFFVPAPFADDPPVPSDDHVRVVEEQPTLCAVRSFKGYVWRQNRWAEEAEKLADSLRDDDRFDKTLYYQVNYDAPFDLFDRRNEIWMVPKQLTDDDESNDV